MKQINELSDIRNLECILQDTTNPSFKKLIGTRGTITFYEEVILFGGIMHQMHTSYIKSLVIEDNHTLVFETRNSVYTFYTPTECENTTIGIDRTELEEQVKAAESRQWDVI